MKYEDIRHKFPDNWYVIGKTKAEMLNLNEWRLKLFPNCSHREPTYRYFILLSRHLRDNSHFYSSNNLNFSSDYENYIEISYQDFIDLVEGKLSAMKKYTKGELNNVPDEIIEVMLDRQVEQGNPRNSAVFVERINNDKEGGGFEWKKTKEGENFWEKVLNQKNYDVFCKLYPKNFDSKSTSSSLDRPNFANEKETIAWLEENYPIGTEFISAYSGDKGTRKGPITFSEKGKYVAATNAEGNNKYFIIHNNKLTPTPPLCDISKPTISDISKAIQSIPKYKYPWKIKADGTISFKDKFKKILDHLGVNLNNYSLYGIREYYHVTDSKNLNYENENNELCKHKPIITLDELEKMYNMESKSNNPYDFFYIIGSDDKKVVERYKNLFKSLGVTNKVSFFSNYYYWIDKNSIGDFILDCIRIDYTNSKKFVQDKRLMSINELEEAYSELLLSKSEPDTQSVPEPTPTIKSNSEPTPNKYSVGNYVVLKRHITWNFSGLMDKFIGQVVQIKTINGSTFTFEGSSGWSFVLDSIERFATYYEIHNMNRSKAMNSFKDKQSSFKIIEIDPYVATFNELFKTNEIDPYVGTFNELSKTNEIEMLPTKQIKIFDRS